MCIKDYLSARIPGMKLYHRLDKLDDIFSKKELPVILKYGYGQYYRRYQTKGILYVKRANLTPMQKRYYAKMYRLGLIEKKCYQCHSAEMAKEIKRNIHTPDLILPEIFRSLTFSFANKALLINLLLSVARIFQNTVKTEEDAVGISEDCRVVEAVFADTSTDNMIEKLTTEQSLYEDFGEELIQSFHNNHNDDDLGYIEAVRTYKYQASSVLRHAIADYNCCHQF